MKEITQVINSIIDEMKQFGQEVTKKSILERMIPIPHVKFVDVDGTFKKARGCWGGGCACTGSCMEVLAVTALDVF